jgi:hypothetical protein
VASRAVEAYAAVAQRDVRVVADDEVVQLIFGTTRNLTAN